MCEICRAVKWPPLGGRRVVIGTTASISLYRIPDLVRELKRKGAEVHVGMSASSSRLVSPEVMKWASETEPVMQITGDIEHIRLFEGPSTHPVLLLAPASYNLIGKIAAGISDTVPSLFFSFAFGRGIPVIVAPAMHRAMLENRIMAENLEKLKNLGVDFVDPELDPEKAKLSDHERIIDHIFRAGFGSYLKGKRILIISGRTEESIDPVRTVTNRSTGTTGYWLARNAYRLGADEIVLAGNSVKEIPRYVESHTVYDTGDLYSTVENLISGRNFDIVLVPAAISDFSLEKLRMKADSSKQLDVQLKPREKLLNIIRRNYEGCLVAFRLNEDGDNIREHFAASRPDFVVFNRIGNDHDPFGDTRVSYGIFAPDSEDRIPEGGKEEATFRLLVHLSGLTGTMKEK